VPARVSTDHVERLRGQLLTSLAIRDQDTGDLPIWLLMRSSFPTLPMGG
jgi:hypothetical protein